MTNKQKELLAKYNRVSEDKSQLQQFAQELIMGEIGMSEEAVEGLIQADKDVLSQIVYDEENKRITFPKGIMPLRFSLNYDDCFVDYSNENILDSNGNVISNLLVNLTPNGLFIDIEDTSELPTILTMDYMFYAEGFGTINAYNLYNSVKIGKYNGDSLILVSGYVAFVDGNSHEYYTTISITSVNSGDRDDIAQLLLNYISMNGSFPIFWLDENDTLKGGYLQNNNDGLAIDGISVNIMECVVTTIDLSYGTVTKINV